MALAGVTVTADGAPGQPSLSTHTSKSGDYRVSPNQPGPVRLTFTLAGYRTAMRDAATADAGRPVTLNVTLEPRGTLGETFSREHLEDIPSPRDPWAILNQTAGVVLTGGVNVGGSASGQQLIPDARSQDQRNTTWTLDGAPVADLVARGTSSLYYDFGSFERIDVATAGADASQQTAGVAIRLVTRSGTDTTRGSARGSFSNTHFESSNITPALFASGAGAGVPLTWYREYGAEAGGPLVRQRVWWWTGGGVQDINGTALGVYQFVPGCPPAGATADMLPQLQSCLAPDRTRLSNVGGNARVRLGASQSLIVSASWFDKTRDSRGATSTKALESTARQTGGSPRVALRHASTIGDRLVLASQASYDANRFSLGFQTPDLADIQVLFSQTTGLTSRSMIGAQTIRRPSTSVSTDAVLALGHALGGEHALKFGVGYRRSPTSTYSHTGGYVIAQYDTAGSTSALLYRDALTAVRFDTVSAYGQDQWTRGRLVVTGGARWDLQNDYASAGSVPANPLAPQLLPAATFAGADPPMDFSDVAPRVSASYDLTGAGTTVVSSSYGVFFGQGISLARALSLTRRVTASAPWSDSNNDLVVQPSELNLQRASLSVLLDPATGLPYPAGTATSPPAQNSRTREAVVSIDRRFGRDLSAVASYIYRIDDRTPSNQVEHHTNYHGLDVSLGRRFGHRWMLSAALTVQSSIGHWPAGVCTQLWIGCAAGTSPDDVDSLDGRPADLSLPRYLAKLNGRVALPWGIGLSATANVQDGFIRNILIIYDPFIGASGTLVAPQGTTRYPTMTMIDAQVDKRVPLAGRASLRLSMVAFNLLNEGTVYSRASNQSLSTYDTVLGIVGPRVLRFGGAISF